MDFLRLGIKCECRLLRISGLNSRPEICAESRSSPVRGMAGREQEVMVNEGSMIVGRGGGQDDRIY